MSFMTTYVSKRLSSPCGNPLYMSLSRGFNSIHARCRNMHRLFVRIHTFHTNAHVNGDCMTDDSELSRHQSPYLELLPYVMILLPLCR